MLNSIPSPIMVIAIILAAGTLGSYCRYVFDNGLDSESASDKPKAIKLRHIVVPGITAAFIVPLFLDVGKSQILGDFMAPARDWQSGFVLFSFCLLAAVSARSFVNTLAREALQKSDTAKEQAVKAIEISEATRDIVGEEAEYTPSDSPAATQLANEKVLADIDKTRFSEDERNVIKAFLTSKFGKRSVSGILRDSDKSTGIDTQRVRIAIAQLIQKGVIHEMTSNKTGGRLYQLNLERMEDFSIT